MKRKSIFALMLILMLAASVPLASCSKSGGSGGKSSEPQTLEQYAVDNPEVQESIDQAMAGSDVKVELKGNDVIYTFDLANMEGYTEDVAKDPDVIESLQSALDNAGSTFGGIALSLETATGISGIRVIVNYTYEGEVLATQTFDSSQAEAANGEPSSPVEESEEEGDAAADEEAEAAEDATEDAE